MFTLEHYRKAKQEEEAAARKLKSFNPGGMGMMGGGMMSVPVSGSTRFPKSRSR